MLRRKSKKLNWSQRNAFRPVARPGRKVFFTRGYKVKSLRSIVASNARFVQDSGRRLSFSFIFPIRARDVIKIPRMWKSNKKYNCPNELMYFRCFFVGFRRKLIKKKKTLYAFSSYHNLAYPFKLFRDLAVLSAGPVVITPKYGLWI